MGTWGPGLYDDDTTCDVRDEWVEKVKQGTAPDEVTSQMIADWGGEKAEPFFWLALADTQWRWGRLEARVRERAAQALAAAADGDLWRDSPAATRTARKKALDRLAAQLAKPQPAPRTIRVRNEALAWKRGQLWAYRLLNGRYAVLRVAAFDPSCGLVGAPVTELLDVVLDDLPPAQSVAGAGVRPARAGTTDSYAGMDAAHRESPMFEPKVKQRGELPRHRLKKLRAAGEPRPATTETKAIGVPWSALDQFLANMFDLGAPRLGTIHAWRAPDGTTRHTVLEWMQWKHTELRPSWQLGALEDPGSLGFEAAPVIRSILVDGFLPSSLPPAVGYRAPTGSVHLASGRVYDWEAVPAALVRPRTP